jgi:hypothetical protein
MNSFENISSEKSFVPIYALLAASFGVFMKRREYVHKKKLML